MKNLYPISTRVLFSISMFFATVQSSNAQKNWEHVDFIKECKVDTKFPGGVAKSFRNNPTFVNDYYFMQASLMKGSSQAGIMQKQGVGSVFAEAALAGISKEALQSLVDEMYVQFVEELKKAGLNITDGNALMQTEYVKDKAGDKNVIAGKTDGTVLFEKVGGTDPNAYDTKEQNIFRPGNANVFTKTGGLGGNFYYKLCKNENINMISLGYVVKFASFEGSKSASRNKLTTSAYLTITPVVMINTPTGLFTWIAYKKPVEGNNDWSKGLVETKSNDGSLLGLSSSADYSIEADEARYIAELRSSISNLQKNLAQHIKNQL